MKNVYYVKLERAGMIVECLAYSKNGFGAVRQIMNRCEDMADCPTIVTKLLVENITVEEFNSTEWKPAREYR